jgi:hypothetical protein
LDRKIENTSTELTFTTFYRRRFFLPADLRFAALRFGALRFGAARFFALAFDFRLVAITKITFYLFFYSKTKQNYTK